MVVEVSEGYGGDSLSLDGYGAADSCSRVMV